MTLAVYQGDLPAQSRVWTNLHDEELRRRAVRAAGEKDVDALVSLTTAYLAHQGGGGVLTSPRTVEAYQLGTRQFALYAREQAVNLLRPHRHDAQNYVNHLLGQGRKPAGVQLKVAAASCPQAPSMSLPRVSRTVVGMPCARSRSTNCCSTPRRDAVHFEPGVGLSGIGLTCTQPLPRALSFLASRSARQPWSLMSLMRAYSMLTRRPVVLK